MEHGGQLAGRFAALLEGGALGTGSEGHWGMRFAWHGACNGIAAGTK